MIAILYSTELVHATAMATLLALTLLRSTASLPASHRLVNAVGAAPRV